jgi:hypothetical protein
MNPGTHPLFRALFGGWGLTRQPGLDPNLREPVFFAAGTTPERYPLVRTFDQQSALFCLSSFVDDLFLC